MLLSSSNKQLDNHSVTHTTTTTTTTSSSNINSFSQEYTKQLNIISKGNGLDEIIYPRNITGMFKGNWGTSIIKPNNNDNNNDNITKNNNEFRYVNGKLLMQLKSVSIPYANDLHFVYGVIKLYGAGPRLSDMLLPIQGISLPKFGIVTLMITPFKTSKLYLQLPDTNFNTLNTSTIEFDKQKNSSVNLETKKQNSTKIINRSLFSSIKNSMKFQNDIKYLDKFMNDKYEKTNHYILRKKQRKLETTETLILNGETASIPVGKTGMILHLVDSSKYLRNNSQANFISVIGENFLPIAFKNLQDIVSQNNRTYYLPTCLESVTLSSKPIEFGDIIDMNEKIAKANDASITKLMEGIVDSTNCDIAYNISAASFILPLDILDEKARHYSVIAVFFCMIQIGLLVLQSRYAQNQAAASKISITGVCALSLLDAALCIVHFLMCTILPKIFFAYFMWIAVLKLLMFCVFEMRTVVMIYQARFAQELSQEGWMGLRRRLASLHLRFYISLFVMMFLAFIFHSSTTIIIMLFYSFWWPQIYHNISSGTRKAFHPAYLWGTAISRLFIPLYFIGCPYNFLNILLDQPLFNGSYYGCFFLIFWVMLQASILSLQDKYGSRFMIPGFLLPSKYDYFRYVNPNTIRSSSIQDGIEQDIENGNLCECVICYNGIQLTNGSYMITPCDHLFHKDCLKNWLEVKLECPVCRTRCPSPEVE
jgi:hypothetical protein